MRSGTPGFVGERLREAREARSLTQTALAEILGITRQAVSQYETGGVSPHPSVMDGVARALNMPVHFFLRESVERHDGSPIFYRSLSAATATARSRAERKFGWIKNIVDYASEFVEFPDVDFPEAGELPNDPSHITDEQIENEAVRLREHWSLGNAPVGNLVYLLENHGAIIARCSLEAETLDAFSQWRWSDGRPYIVLNTEKESAARSRMDAAHELGHLMLHRSVQEPVLRRSEKFKLMEKQAFRFGGAFLLSASKFSEDFVVPTLDALRVLKGSTGVSIGAMLMRAQDLGFLPEDQAQRLWRHYSRRGWKRQEPLDDETPLEQPQLLRQALDAILSNAIQSREQLLNSLAYSPSDIEELAGLPRNYLREPVPSVSILPSNDSRAETRTPKSAEGSVVPFKPPTK